MYDISGLILAGGRSRRMGREKAALRLPGTSRTFVDQLVDQLSALCAEVILVAHDPSQCLALQRTSVRMVYDEVPDHGPLMGLYSGLRASLYDHALVVAVDMPFVQKDLLTFLLTQPLNGTILMPVVEHIPQVLLAVYPRSLLTMIEALLQSGRKDPRALLNVAPVRYIDEAQLRVIDPQLRSFINVNTPEEFERIKS